VLLRAENDPDRLRLVLRALESIEEIHVHLHLTEVLMRELPQLQVDEDEAAEQPIVEDEVDVEVIALEREPLLSRDEAEAFPHLEEEFLEPADDRLFEIPLLRRRLLAKVEELEDERILDHVAGYGDLLAVAREIAH